MGSGGAARWRRQVRSRYQIGLVGGVAAIVLFPDGPGLVLPEPSPVPQIIIRIRPLHSAMNRYQLPDVVVFISEVLGYGLKFLRKILSLVCGLEYQMLRFTYTTKIQLVI